MVNIFLINYDKLMVMILIYIVNYFVQGIKKPAEAGFLYV
ncbi:hypothetical protein HMPREF9086_2852 [Enterobacter hormaechei ATCC 49162]|nr:hypothetical protein HMPREF9086_2852 [Enterobacter hormaechei ATCC 49162]